MSAKFEWKDNQIEISLPGLYKLTTKVTFSAGWEIAVFLTKHWSGGNTLGSVDIW